MAVWGVEDRGAGAGGCGEPAAPASNGAAAAAAAAGGDGGDGDGKSKKALAKEAKKRRRRRRRRSQGGRGHKIGETKKSAGIPEVKQDLIPISFEPPSGTRDFFPDEMRVRNWLFAQFRSVARSFAFQEYDAPVLENTALFKRKGGEEITDQMYCSRTRTTRRTR